jgi:hypothetical protein
VHKAVKLANDGSGVDVDGRASLRTLAASGRLALCCPSGACQPSSLTSPVAAHVPMPTRRPQFISATNSRPPGGELCGQREAELLHSRTRSPRWASRPGWRSWRRSPATGAGTSMSESRTACAGGGGGGGRPHQDGVAGVGLVHGGDLLASVVDDEEPRQRAALGQAAGAGEDGRGSLDRRWGSGGRSQGWTVAVGGPRRSGRRTADGRKKSQ